MQRQRENGKVHKMSSIDIAKIKVDANDPHGESVSSPDGPLFNYIFFRNFNNSFSKIDLYFTVT